VAVQAGLLGVLALAAVAARLVVLVVVLLDVAAAVDFDRALFPDGVNVEVLTPARGGTVAMRVHERGVGETRSCGTGTVAAAVAALADQDAATGSLRVRVPGGEVAVEITEASSYLRGPSVLVAHGELSRAWWAEHC
jgi:diaminopimelate epimerase